MLVVDGRHLLWPWKSSRPRNRTNTR